MKIYLLFFTIIAMCSTQSLLSREKVLIDKSLSLHQVLISARNALKSQHDTRTTVNVFTLLNSDPSLYLAYLGSGDAQGSEVEIGIQLEFMSPAHRDLSHKYVELNAKMNHLIERNQDLYISGQVRNLIWSILISDAELDWLSKQQQWLNESKTIVEKLVKSGSSSRLAMNRLSLSLAKTEEQLLKADLAIQSKLMQYQKLTGLSVLPALSDEQLKEKKLSVQQHPALALIQLDKVIERLNFKATSTSQNTWNASLFQKNVDLSGQSDTQVGISLEIPLSFSKSYHTADYQTWKQTNAELEQQMFQLHSQLGTTLLKLQSEGKFLAKQAKLLKKQRLIISNMEQELANQKASGAVSLERYYEQLIELSEFRFEQLINQMHQSKNIADQNQTLGFSL